MRTIITSIILLLATTIVAQSVSTKKCRICGKPLAQCQYKGRHPSFTTQSSVADIKKVDVVFRGQPDVVYISVDGEAKGTNYADISLVPGKHSVTYSKEGYESRTEDVIIPQGQTYTINYRLEANATEATMDYTISTNPDGCFVYIDDNWVGTTPIVVKEKNGTHKLKVEKIGYQTKEYSGYIFSSNPNIQVNLDPISDSKQNNKESEKISRISGQVLDNHLDPIIGASVSVAGTKMGTVTDIDGNFALSNVPNDASIVVSFVGFKKKTVQVQPSMRIILAK